MLGRHRDSESHDFITEKWHVLVLSVPLCISHNVLLGFLPLVLRKYSLDFSSLSSEGFVEGKNPHRSDSDGHMAQPPYSPQSV